MTHDDLTTRTIRHRGRRVFVAGAAATVVVAGLVLFQPWKLVVDDVVEESLPAVASSLPSSSPQVARPSSTAAPSGSQAPSSITAASGSPAPSPTLRVVARGELISQEHATSGTVVVLALPDGSRVLRLQDLRTSNGPDVKVWLSDAAVRPGPDGWQVFDDGRYADLGSLKGNVGSQNYAIPADVDLARLSSLSLWCDRFNVSFGAAVLTPV